jgi:NAD+ synthase (glutamine-hydrolysing)
MFLRLLNEWGGQGKLSPRQIADKVQRFFFYHQIKYDITSIAT